MNLSILIPVFNEEENLPELIPRLRAAAQSTAKPFELIFIDDGSRGKHEPPLQKTELLREQTNRFRMRPLGKVFRAPKLHERLIYGGGEHHGHGQFP